MQARMKDAGRFVGQLGRAGREQAGVEACRLVQQGAAITYRKVSGLIQPVIQQVEGHGGDRVGQAVTGQ